MGTGSPVDLTSTADVGQTVRVTSLEFDVHVRPGARRTTVGGVHDGVLVVTVAAPPADGQANDAVVTAIASAFGVRVSAVELVRGHRGRRKRIRIDGPRSTLAATLDALLQATG